MKKIVSLTLAALLTAGSLSGCGGNSGTAGTTAAESADSKAAEGEEKQRRAVRRQQERNAESRNTHDPEAPVLTLKVAEVKTAVGVGPAWVELIGTLSDDKDGYSRNYSATWK